MQVHTVKFTLHSNGAHVVSAPRLELNEMMISRFNLEDLNKIDSVKEHIAPLYLTEYAFVIGIDSDPVDNLDEEVTEYAKLFVSNLSDKEKKPIIDVSINHTGEFP